MNLRAYGALVLNSGGADSKSFGCYILITSGRAVKISVKTAKIYYQYTTAEFPLNGWVHVVFTWSLTNAGLIHLYIYGCDADATNGYAYNVARFDTMTRSHKFRLGCGNYDNSLMFAEPDIDELILCDQVLTPL